MEDVEGFILVGGASSRMGADKALLRLGGRTFVGLAAEALGAVAGVVRVVGSRPGAAGHGLAVVPDVYEHLGALGGLHAALSACGARWSAVLSCDLPFVTAGLLARLASFRGEGFDAVAPFQEDGRPQPLCALYAAAACRAVAEELIREGELRPRALLERVRTRWVAFDELADLPGSADFFRNVNTPPDYEEARKRWPAETDP
ncbi:MAG TPA: molybdenum cofactor guanylyltransferase [Pyrinomonadaceae bacterium]|nr:molybdenum cofactor guanylyltransferase [Pyrinomonadaceae bacterium]